MRRSTARFRLAALAAIAVPLLLAGVASATEPEPTDPVAGILTGVLPAVLPGPTPTGDAPTPTGKPPRSTQKPPRQSVAPTPTEEPPPPQEPPKPPEKLTPTPTPTPTPTVEPTPTVPPTVVTLGFDDNTTDQYGAGLELKRHGLPGVFYVNSGRLDVGGDYLSTSQVRTLQAMGHEIGGHTVFHLHLSQQDAAEQQRQICTDRVRLLALGFAVGNLAYPFGDLDASSQAAAEQCGYNSARTTGGVGCNGCPAAETMPPAKPYASRSISGLNNATTAGHLIAAVQRAQAAGGWLQLVFHHLCGTGPCAANGIRASQFSAFVGWLAQQRDAAAVRVATVHDIIGGAVKPGVKGPAPTATTLKIANASFEESGPTGLARCFEVGTNGDGNSFTATRVSGARNGAWAQRIVVSAVPGAIKLLSTQDLGSCAPPITARHGYTVSVWYRSPAPIKLVAYARRPQGSYSPLGMSHEFPASVGWSLATWVSKGAPPTGHAALSVGVVLHAKGTYLFDDFSVRDAGLAPVSTDTSVEADAHEGDEAGLFVPSDLAPPVAVGPAANVASTSKAFGWRLGIGIAGALGLMFVVVLALDHRLAHLHRATFRPPRPPRSPRS